MRTALMSLGCACAALLLVVVVSNGALLDVELTTPTVFYDSTGQLTYDPGAGFLSALVAEGPDPDPIPSPPELGVDAVPIAVLFPTGPVFVQAPRAFDVLIRVGTSGELLGGVLGDDLILTGVVDQDRDGTPEYSGTLLTGEVLAFGFEDTGTTTDRYDMLFAATGGELLDVLGSDYIGVTVTSENSTFTGDFTVPFSGGAKGNIGTALNEPGVCVIDVTAVGHAVGGGSHPPVNRQPLPGLLVGIYDKSEGSCARDWDPQDDGISHNEYPDIVGECVAAATDTTDENGEIRFYLPPGDYIVIGNDGTEKHLGVSASDCFDGVEMNKFLQQITRADNSKVPGKSQKHQCADGSELRIIEPEYVVWDDTVQPYPFIFETVDDIGVTAMVAPPEGFVSDYEALAAQVTDETESVQFTITEVGSDLVPTETTFDIVHDEGVETVRSDVDIKLTPTYAKQRGFNVRALRAQGLTFEPDKMGGRSQDHPLPAKVQQQLEKRSERLNARAQGRPSAASHSK